MHPKRRLPGAGDARRLALACAAPLLLAACEPPFGPWGEEEHRPEAPQLFVDLSWGEPFVLPSSADTLPPTLYVNGRLTLDRLRDGRRRAVRRPELIVAGHPVSPRREADGWTYVYEATRPSTWEAMRDSVLVVEAPLLEGITATAPELRFPLWTREGGKEVTIRAGVDPVLHLRAAGGEQAGPLTWSLQTSGTGGGSFSMGGSGPPPTVIRIPAENLPASSDGRYGAVLEIVQATPSYSGPEARFAYHVGAWLRTRVHWRLRVESP